MRDAARTLVHTEEKVDCTTLLKSSRALHAQSGLEFVACSVRTDYCSLNGSGDLTKLDGEIRLLLQQMLPIYMRFFFLQSSKKKKKNERLSDSLIFVRSER